MLSTDQKTDKKDNEQFTDNSWLSRGSVTEDHQGVSDPHSAESVNETAAADEAFVPTDVHSQTKSNYVSSAGDSLADVDSLDCFSN